MAAPRRRSVAAVQTIADELNRLLNRTLSRQRLIVTPSAARTSSGPTWDFPGGVPFVVLLCASTVRDMIQVGEGSVDGSESTDDTHDVPRVDYFALSTGLFTALTENERVIVTHFPADEEYVRTLLDSDYP